MESVPTASDVVPTASDVVPTASDVVPTEPVVETKTTYVDQVANWWFSYRQFAFGFLTGSAVVCLSSMIRGKRN
jgi:hypothetical protein